MACPTDGKAVIHSMGSTALPIANVELLGSSEKITFNQAADALEVTLPAAAACKYAYALKLTPAQR
jgi:alpha-L-fucosidase